LGEQGFRVDLATGFDELVERAHTGGACLIDIGLPDARIGIRRLVSLPAPPRVLALVNREEQIGVALDAGAHGCVAAADGLDRLVHLLRCDILVPPRANAAQRALHRARSNGTEPRLTAREVEVLAGLVRGESTKTLAERLHVRPATARTHVQHLLAKLGVHSRLQAVAFVIEHPIEALMDQPDRDVENVIALGRTAS
jgi:DNA-binding NarL/FixJ family response regulator